MKKGKKLSVAVSIALLASISTGCGNSENNSESNKGVVRNVRSIVLAKDWSSAILDDGGLYTWGDNEGRWLGNGRDDEISKPEKILDNVVSVSWGTDAGQEFGAALTEDGSLYTWGNNGRGQLGTGDNENSLTPVKVMDNVKDFSIGGCCIGAITKDGSLYTWGGKL